jgi:uncharacterized membrane protein
LWSSIEEVFRVWSRLDDFPCFMEHVRGVSVAPDGRSHWRVAGPGGDVEWDAEITRRIDNQLLAWHTLPGSPVQHTGVVRFERSGRGTRVDIRMSYATPAGALGRALATLARKDPKTAMDEDLLRLKSLLEDGKATAHGRTVTREEISA